MSAGAALRRLGRAVVAGVRGGVTLRGQVWGALAFLPAIFAAVLLGGSLTVTLAVLVPAFWAGLVSTMEVREEVRRGRGSGDESGAVPALASIQGSGELPGTFDVLVRFGSEGDREAFYAAARAARLAQQSGGRS